jgi:hypothetical protein
MFSAVENTVRPARNTQFSLRGNVEHFSAVDAYLSLVRLVMPLQSLRKVDSPRRLRRLIQDSALRNVAVELTSASTSPTLGQLSRFNHAFTPSLPFSYAAFNLPLERASKGCLRTKRASDFV